MRAIKSLSPESGLRDLPKAAINAKRPVPNAPTPSLVAAEFLQYSQKLQLRVFTFRQDDLVAPMHFRPNK